MVVPNRTSSLLFTASLLYALLKLGYGRLLLDVAPGADAVRANSGTRLAMDVAGSESRPLSFSDSLSFRRRWDYLRTSPVTGSIFLGLELLVVLWGRFGSFSLFERRRLSLGLSSTPFSESL